MSQIIMLSGLNGEHLKDTLHTSLKETKPQFVGIASAFVSTNGVKDLSAILKACGAPQCRLIAGTDKAITHPEALYSARRLGWDTRLGKAPLGIFHPKLLVAGHEVSPVGLIGQLCCVYVGSSNLTAGGLQKNVECGLVAKEQGCPETASTVFSQLWAGATPATNDELRNYAARFAEIARRRKAAELDDLGVSDSQILPASPADLQAVKPPDQPAVAVGFATAAWAGVQSFTGEYRFQLEFPRAAGIVISQLLRLNRAKNAQVGVYCPDDGSTRQMQYKFYGDNGMFRLNIQNNVSGVAWARQHKDGIAIIEKGPQGGAPLRLQFLQPGSDANEIVKRSVALGTWGKTSTRIYGWY
jgi:HKD family nuclease